MSKPSEIYHTPIDLEDLVEKLDVTYDDLFCEEQNKNRHLYLFDTVSVESTAAIIQCILRYNIEDYGIDPAQRKPIKLYIHSGGGDVFSGFALIDVMKASKTPVHTVNFGYAYSMAFLIAMAGDKRFSSEHGTFMLHDGSLSIENNAAKAEDFFVFTQLLKTHEKEFVLACSNLDSNEYETRYKDDWFMSAAEAKEKGFVDFLIGVDCELDDVL